MRGGGSKILVATGPTLMSARRSEICGQDELKLRVNAGASSYGQQSISAAQSGHARARNVSSAGSAASSGADASRPDCKSAVSKREARNAKANMSVALVMPKPPLLWGNAYNLT